MNILKKILSALLAVTVLCASANIAALPVYAAENDDEVQTFDKLHYMSETVDYYLFDAGFGYSEDDIKKSEAYEKKLLRSLPKSKLENVTYRDLANVTSLDLSGLELTKAPACINYMVNLRTLNLSNNLLQNDGLSELSLIACTHLTNVNLGKNYLHKVPSWFINNRVTTRNIKENFIEGESPRSIKVLNDEYYYVDGEVFDEGALKNRILNSVRFSDNSMLPGFLYDYEFPPYIEGRSPSDESDGMLEFDNYELDFVNWDFSAYLVPKPTNPDPNTVYEKRVKASEDTIVTVTIRLFKDSVNDNTKATVKIYILNGRSTTSLKKRVTQLIDECKALNKSDYTESSWNRLDIAQQTAEALVNYSGSDADMLSSAFTSLNSAKNALEKTASTAETKKAIDTLVKVGNGYKEADYTPSSWARFKAAFDTLKALQSNKNASEEDARRAIKNFQSAQSSLARSSLLVPGTAPKSDFERIYGENMTQTYNGTTLDGMSYNWLFRGSDITVPVDFKPEVKNTDTASADILFEAGSASSFRLFKTEHSGAFPGMATLDLEIANFADGNYYLYRWDTAKKSGKMAGTATVKNNHMTTQLDQGGTYYISPNVRNFDLKSSRFGVDDAGKRILIPLFGNYTVNNLKSTMEHGSYVRVTDENGNNVSGGSELVAGLTVSSPGGDPYKIVMNGDSNNDGTINSMDLLALVNNVLKSDPDIYMYDVNGDGKVNSFDVLRMVDAVLGK